MPLPPSRAERGTSPRRSLLSAAALASALVAVLATGCGGPAASSSATTAAASSNCRLTEAMMLARLPGFVTMFRQDLPQVPGDSGVQGHPRWDVTQYVCGKGNGFVADDIMYGKYRAQDNALARSLGYRVGRLPLLPYMGTAVSALPHGVFEAYEVVLQFRSAKAAADWLRGPRRSPAPHGAAGLSLPGGFLTDASFSGPNDGRHEYAIGVNGRIGDSVVEMSISGGRELSWPDVQPVWASAYVRLERYLHLDDLP